MPLGRVWRAVGAGAVAVATIAVSACSPPPSTAQTPRTPVQAQPSAAPVWQRLWLPAAQAQSTATIPIISDPVSGVCRSHAGCEGARQHLPACTEPGALPSGFTHLRGRLEATEWGPQLQAGPQDVLSCWSNSRGQEQLVTGDRRYNLGLGCSGDRTGWCCPYPPGTGVQVVAKLTAGDGSTPSLSEYWLCADSAAAPPPQPASVIASAPPALVDLGESPGVVVWTTQRGFALWRVAEPASVSLQQSGKTPFSCVSLAPSGGAAFSIDGAGEAALWSLPQGRKLSSVAGFAAPRHAERIEPDLSCNYLLARKLEWSPAGDRLLTVQANSVIRLWDTARGTEQQLESLHAAESGQAGYFSPDGSMLLVPTATGQVELRQVEGGRVVAKTKGSAGRFAPDQRQVVVDDSAGGASVVRVWQPKSGDVRSLLPDACGVDISDDGRLLAALAPCDSGPQVVIELASARRLLERDGAFRPFFSTSQSRPPRFRDDLAFLIEKTEPPSRPRDWAAASSKPELLVLPRVDGIELWTQARTLAKLAVAVPRWQHGMMRYAGLAFSPDGKKLASPEWLWNAAARKRVIPLDAAVPRSQLIFSPDSRFLATWSWRLAGASPGAMRAMLRVFDASSGKLLQRLDVDSAAAPRQLQLGLSSPVWLPHSAVLLLPVLGDAGAVQLLNVADGKEARVALRADGSLGLPNGLASLRDFWNGKP